MSEMFAASADSANQMPEAPGFFILHHHLQDLSVECPFGRIAEDAFPAIQQKHRLRVSVSKRKEQEIFVVDVHVGLVAGLGEQIIFMAELTYRAEVQLHLIPPEEIDEVLRVQVPDALQETLRSALEYNGSLAGYPEMRVGELDFAAAFAEPATA